MGLCLYILIYPIAGDAGGVKKEAKTEEAKEVDVPEPT